MALDKKRQAELKKLRVQMGKFITQVQKSALCYIVLFVPFLFFFYYCHVCCCCIVLFLSFLSFCIELRFL
jgi:hypothetical protein